MFGETKSVWWGFVFAFVLGAGGCKPSGGGAISPQGFKHSKHAYQVKATADGRLMSDQWKLDNYQEGKRGYKAKSGGIYVIRYDLDVDGDGDFEKSSEELAYDPRFKHLVHDGVIFLKTIPISTDLEQKNLAVLMDGFVEEVAGAGYEVVQFHQHMSLLVEWAAKKRTREERWTKRAAKKKAAAKRRVATRACSSSRRQAVAQSGRAYRRARWAMLAQPAPTTEAAYN